MDTSQKKRSIFGGFSLFGSRNATEPASSETKPDVNRKPSPTTNSPLPPISRALNTRSLFESPAKRASNEQLQSRRISRPQGPSSKIAQAVTNNNFSGLGRASLSSSTSLPANMVAADGTPKRMPGDNPYKKHGAIPGRMPGDNPHKNTLDGTPKRMPGDNPHRFASATPKVSDSTPKRTSADTPNKSTNIFAASRPVPNLSASTATTPRGLFGASTTQRPGIPFSPRVPANTMRTQFQTPGKARRPSLEGMSPMKGHLGEPQEFFSMKIENPMPDLTGERITREMPKDENRVGSIYADEYLAHYCPPHFNDLERRQFFCILDLRRLKYIANEIFTSRDWKINILQFAKEFEKSRSLIMLRYGLYEFKTVRASESVKKEWRAKHGIVSSDDENVTGNSPLPNAGSKRKAEDESASAEPASVLTNSTTNANKRARGNDCGLVNETNIMDSSKNKRKAGSPEPDENQPSKLRKPASPPSKNPPSATKALFEKIANNTHKSGDTAIPNSTLFSSTPSKTPNGVAGRSVFDGAKPALSTNNIFGHLSDNSKGSGNDDADAESAEETDSEAEGNSEAPEVTKNGQSAGPSQGSLFAFKPASTNGASSASSETGEKEKGKPQPRSIFDRLSYGNDGTPLRKQDTPKSGEDASKASTPALSEENSTTDATSKSVAPANNTWKPDSPIKFAPTAATNAQAPSMFAGSVSKPSVGASIFANSPAKKTEEIAPSSTGEAPKTGTANIFAASAQALPATDTTSARSTGLFGAPSTSSFFGQPKETGATPSAELAPASKPQGFGTDGSSVLNGSTSSGPASNIFAGRQKPAFGETAKKEDSTPTPAATTSFGFPATSAPEAGKSMFGSATSAAPATTSVLGSQNSGASVFKSSTLFGSTGKNDYAAGSSAPASTFFGAANSSTAKTADSGSSAPANSLFGAITPASSSTSNPLFGAMKPTEATAAEPKTTPGFSFGSTSTTPAPSFFGTGASGSGATPSQPESKVANPFGFVQSKPAETANDDDRLKDDRPAKRTFGGSTLGSSSAPANGNMFGASNATPTFSFEKPQDDFNTAKSIFPTFGGGSTPAETKPMFGLGGNNSKGSGIFANGGDSGASSFQFGQNTTPATSQSAPGGSTSFTFGSNNGSDFKNPFATNSTAPSISFEFGSGSGSGAGPAVSFGANQPNSQSTPASSFVFNAGSTTPTVNFGVASGSTTPATSFTFGANQSESTPSGNIFAFSGAQGLAPEQQQAPNMFTNGLAPGGGTSTGTNTPFTFGGASSLATTPAAGTPEPGAENDDGKGKDADGDDAPQEQISLTEGGPGEEDEVVVHEVRTKALKFVKDSETDSPAGKDKKSPWRTQGVGPLRILKHKTTGAVRLLLRAEPRGHVALNKALLPDFEYKPEPAGGKYVKITTSDDAGAGLEMWMLQVKTADLAKTLAEQLEANKGDSSKK